MVADACLSVVEDSEVFVSLTDSDDCVPLDCRLPPLVWEEPCEDEDPLESPEEYDCTLELDPDDASDEDEPCEV